MRPETIYRLWIAFAAASSILSAAGLWLLGERTLAWCGIAAGAFHLLWGLDVPALLRGRWRRRAIVIPCLRSPLAQCPPRLALVSRLRAPWRHRG
jgi:hypothetical protein